MSTLEKTIVLLREMPEQSLEFLYDFIRSIWIHQNGETEHLENSVDTSESMEGFRVLQSFAGTLPADFEDCLQDSSVTAPAFGQFLQSLRKRHRKQSRRPG